MGDAGCDSTTAGAAAGANARDADASRSRLTTRPPGPEPVTTFRSTPASRAIRLASGDAFTRVTSPGAGPTPPASRIPPPASRIPPRASRIPPPDGAGVGGRHAQPWGVGAV